MVRRVARQGGNTGLTRSRFGDRSGSQTVALQQASELMIVQRQMARGGRLIVATHGQCTIKQAAFEIGNVLAKSARR